MRLNTVYTVGHSTRSLTEFIDLLAQFGIGEILDVRTLPRSRHNPQFNRETLPAALAATRVGYRHLPALGGLRHARPDSLNGGWRNLSFRGFADYMQTPGFAAGIAEVVEHAAQMHCALMCAEAVPWRCHRSLIADALTVRGIRVEEIIGHGPPTLHRLTPFASVFGLTITYPPAPEEHPAG